MEDIKWKILFAIFIFSSTAILEFVHAADNAVDPIRPRQCYSCTGLSCQRTTRLNTTKTCSDVLDICITIFQEFAVVAKGCLLDMPDSYRSKCDDHQNNPECFKCFGQLCNNKGREDFKCIECNDSLKCDQDTTAMTAVQCGIPTAPNSYCYVRKLDGSRTQRGCLLHLADQMRCLKESSCSMCLSNDGLACNSYKIDTTNAISRGAQDMAAISSIPLCLISLLVTAVGLLR